MTFGDGTKQFYILLTENDIDSLKGGETINIWSEDGSGFLDFPYGSFSPLSHKEICQMAWRCSDCAKHGREQSCHVKLSL